MANTKRIYTVATLNGYNRSYVHEYISFEFNLYSTKELSKEQEEQLINHLSGEEIMAEKKYVGSGKEKVFNDGGSIVNISLKASDLKGLVNEKGYIRLTVAKRKEEDKYGNTHTVYDDGYRPQPKDADPF